MTRAVPALVAVWLVAVTSGMALLWRYKMTGSEGAPPPAWPLESALPRDAARHTLVMLAHPHCPCTRASLDELARLASRLRDRVKVVVAFVEPEGVPAGWARADLWHAAEAIPGATVLADPEGREAARFGALASGQVVLYDAAGRLAFHGGITGARGHLGDNAGERRLAAVVRHGSADRANSPVFGCALAAPEEGRMK